MFLKVPIRILAAVVLALPASAAAVVVHTDSSGNPASCGETTSTVFNIGTPNPDVAAGDLLVLTMSGVGDANPKNLISSITVPTGVKPFQFAKAVSAIYDANGGGRSYIAYARVVSPFTNGVGISVLTNASTFMGGCLYDVSGLSGVLDAQAGVEISDRSSASNPTPVLTSTVTNELAVMVESCQNVIGSPPVNPPWIPAGINGAGGCPAGYVIAPKANALLQAIGNQSAPGSAAAGIALFK